jgi:Choline/ethanolamine kinase.
MIMMKNTIDTIIQEVFQTKEYQLYDLEKGITNNNYLLIVNNASFVVRIPKIQGIFDREYEAEVLEFVRPLGIDLSTFYFDSVTGIKITPYIEKLEDFSTYKHPSSIKRIATVIRKLHDAKIHTGKRFAPLEKLKLYQEGIQTPVCDYSQYSSIITAVSNYHCEEILCHNDIVAGNLCFTNENTYLIDYEYAGDNDPLFDVMSFITENELTPEEESEFLHAYFEEEIPYQELEMWRDFHNLLWLSWANMMFDETKESIFQTIAEQKKSALEKRYLRYRDTLFT